MHNGLTKCIIRTRHSSLTIVELDMQGILLEMKLTYQLNRIEWTVELELLLGNWGSVTYGTLYCNVLTFFQDIQNSN